MEFDFSFRSDIVEPLPESALKSKNNEINEISNMIASLYKNENEVLFFRFIFWRNARLIWKMKEEEQNYCMKKLRIM